MHQAINGCMRPFVVVACLLVGACSSVPRGGGYYENDGPHERPPIDVLAVPDAVPRDEPLAAKGNKPYTVFGVNYVPLADARGYRERGIASWYGKKFHGKSTSSGEPYDMYAMTAAHRTLPLPCYLRVRNLQNGRTVVVRVNDRGPFLHNRLIDLSYTAAARLGILGTGTGMVEIESVDLTPPPAPAPPVTTVANNSSGALIANAEAASTAPTTAPRLSVQVGAFSRYENAAGLRDRLTRAGLNSVYIQSIGSENPSVSNAAMYRVRIGPVETVERGDQLVAEVARYGVSDALLVVE